MGAVLRVLPGRRETIVVLIQQRDGNASYSIGLVTFG